MLFIGVGGDRRRGGRRGRSTRGSLEERFSAVPSGDIEWTVDAPVKLPAGYREVESWHRYNDGGRDGDRHSQANSK